MIFNVHIFTKEARGIIEGIMDPDRECEETGFSGSKMSGFESNIPTDITDNSESEHEKVPQPPQ